jgi:hypothetical protein
LPTQQRHPSILLIDQQLHGCRAGYSRHGKRFATWHGFCSEERAGLLDQG